MDFEVKSSNNRFYNIILDIAEERISDLEDNIVGITQNAPQGYKQMVNMKGKAETRQKEGKHLTYKQWKFQKVGLQKRQYLKGRQLKNFHCCQRNKLSQKQTLWISTEEKLNQEVDTLQ